MGFLEAGTPLPWADSLQWAAYVRKHGIEQFINCYNRIKDKHNFVLKWGDEIEYHLVQLDAAAGTARVALIAPEILEKLEKEDKEKSFPILSAWRPEYGSWMIEATPGMPYGGDTLDLRNVERNMAMRRYRITSALPDNVRPFSLVNFPLLGVGPAFTNPPRASGGPFSRSAYIPDACISPHPRFGTLTANIRRRRGRKVEIQVPLFVEDGAVEGRRPPVGGSGATAAVAALSAGAAVATTRRRETWVTPSSSSSSSSSSRFVAEVEDPRFCCPDVTGDAPCMGLKQTEATERADAVSAAAGAPCSSSSSSSAAAAASSEGGEEKVEDDVGPAHLPVPGQIHMDAMAFGMGCCCLQVTFQARDLSESRYLYDQLAVLSPLMLALTANAPVWRGHLADVDTRWDVISASVDCRTPVERGVEGPAEPAPAWMSSPVAPNAASGGRRRIAKSRYSTVDCYISDDARLSDAYNDVPLEYDAGAYARLLEAGIDARLARHVAHLFIRDPLVIFSERVHVDDAATMEHFENIQSTNWRSMRWKPPPSDAPQIGWRVELRTMEAQVTDFENAAFTVFVVLLSRVLLFFDLNLYMPISKVDENCARARTREAAWRQKFWFRWKVTERVCAPSPAPSAAAAVSHGGASAEPDYGGCPCEIPTSSPGGGSAASAASSSTEEEVVEMSLAEILLGKGAAFPGLVPLLHLYLDFIECDDETRDMVDDYLRLVVGRATGEIMTGATYQRAFIRSHPAYTGDSVVPPRVAHDLLAHLDRVAAGAEGAPSLLGSSAPAPIVFTAEKLEHLRASDAAAFGLATGSGGAAAATSSSSSAAAAGGSAASTSSPSPAPLETGAADLAPVSVVMHVKPEEAHAGAWSAPQSPALRALTGHHLLPVPDGPEVLASRMSPLRHVADGKGPGAPDAAASAAAGAAGAVAPSPNGTRMRGASYAEEREVVYECTALNTLVEDLRVKYGLHPHHGRRGAGGLRRTSGFEDGTGVGGLPH